ncbi:MAG TPA: tripartite tricarboxylate transporter TctB family protein [Methylomirabilota bacterium]|nr:tripartite tricarboxylate transporter TctB family protein [Methylomirabilota bacterium]
MLTAQRAAGGVLVLVGAVALWEGLRFPVGTLWRPGPAYLPAVLSLLLVAIGGVLVVRGRHGVPLAAVDWQEARHAVAILGVCVFVSLALERLGWRLTVAVALFFLLRVLERRGLLFAGALTLGIALGSFFLFHTLLKVPLPRGPFGL